MGELKIKKVKPLTNKIITTDNKYDEDCHLTMDGMLIDKQKTKGALKLYQTVLAIGPMVKDIKVGDVVLIDPTRYGVRDWKESVSDQTDQYSKKGKNMLLNITFDIPSIIVDGHECLELYEADCKYILLEYEE